jgi:hypothetical protein
LGNQIKEDEMEEKYRKNNGDERYIFVENHGGGEAVCNCTSIDSRKMLTCN